jgi:hypothetical protein
MSPARSGLRPRVCAFGAFDRGRLSDVDRRTQARSLSPYRAPHLSRSHAARFHHSARGGRNHGFAPDPVRRLRPPQRGPHRPLAPAASAGCFASLALLPSLHLLCLNLVGRAGSLRETQHRRQRCNVGNTPAEDRARERATTAEHGARCRTCGGARRAYHRHLAAHVGDAIGVAAKRAVLAFKATCCCRSRSRPLRSACRCRTASGASRCRAACRVERIAGGVGRTTDEFSAPPAMLRRLTPVWPRPAFTSPVRPRSGPSNWSQKSAPDPPPAAPGEAGLSNWFQ